MQMPGLHEKLTVSGPYIVLLGYEPQQSIWRASVMIVTPPPRGAVLPAEPTLSLSDQGVVLDATVQSFTAAELNTIEPADCQESFCVLSEPPLSTFTFLTCASCPAPL